MRTIATQSSATLPLAAVLAPARQASAATPFETSPYSPSLDAISQDRPVNPCIDFYPSSRGGWRKNNPVPPGHAI
jgi:putative endopeptidase